MDTRPGLNARRLASLVAEAVKRCDLNLSGAVALTEAATGAYAVTPVLAAAAGARVFAVTRDTAHGTVAEVSEQTFALARILGVDDRIRIVTQIPREVLAQCDIVTNSGHVRPIDAAMIASMKPTAVIPLMYEAWEFRPDDLDLEACRRAGIMVVGTHERHPNVDVFSFLGLMAVQQLLEAGVAPYRASVLLLCDNAFCPYIERGLGAAGAHVDTADRLGDAPDDSRYDAIVCALTPGAALRLDAEDAGRIARLWPGAVVAQYWGDIDREALAAGAVPVWPPKAPRRGHMGILPSGPGPEAIVRLQSGGLKAAEVMWRGTVGPALDYAQPLWAGAPA
jgi:hypothetical protein